MKAKYALKALFHLARERPSQPVLLAAIAEAEAIPHKFLEGIMNDLKNHGLVTSKKGPRGGYMLRQPAAEIMLGDVLRIIEGPLAPVPCVSQSAHIPCGDCKLEMTCGVRIAMAEVREAVAAVVDRRSIAQIVGEIQAAEQRHRQNAMYHI